MVPTAVVVVLIDVAELTHRSGTGATGALGLSSTILTAAFYALIIWCYLRRGPAVATSTSVTAHVAAVAGTLAPFAFPLLPAAAVRLVR